MFIENLLTNFSFCFLFCTMVFYWVQGIFFSNQNLIFFGNLGILFSNFCLIGLLLSRWANSGHFPLSNLYESLLFLSWSITTVHLLLYKINEKRDTEENNKKEGKNYQKFLNQNLFPSLWLGCVTSPTALFINTFASFSLPEEMQRPSALVPALQSNWLFMHVTVMILSYAALIIGCLLSFVFLIITGGQDIKLRNSLFRKYYSNSKLLMNSLYIDKIYKNFFLNANIIENNIVLISNSLLLPNNKNNLNLLISKKEEINWDNMILLEKWWSSNNLNLSFSSTLELFYLLIKSKTYNIDGVLISAMSANANQDAKHQNLSLSFCYDRPIINIENRNLFQKIYSDSLTESRSGSSLMRMERISCEIDEFIKFSKNKKNLTYKIAKNLDNLSYRILGIGFPFLTIGILSGSVWANEAWGSYWSWDPKETWALLTWLVFAVYFHSRLIKGWEGKKPAILATLGFIVVWICFIGVNLLKSGLHSYGFFS